MEVRIRKDLCYRTTVHRPLRLDLFVPTDVPAPPPLIVYIPMGGMVECRKEREAVPRWIVEYGFALASIECRVSSEEPAPAQVYDCKAAVRWLRVHAGDFGCNGRHMGAWGHSAGGMLAALVATSGGHPALEEPGVENAEISAEIQAACDSAGAPHDLTTFADPEIRARYAPVAENLRRYLGGAVADRLDLARRVSPSTYISPACPPMFLLHGADDRDVSPEDTARFHRELTAAGVDATLRLLPKVGHDCGAALDRTEIAEFFRRVLHVGG